MAIYGLDLYGKTLYGAPGQVVFDASPMLASQTGYGALQVTWSTPQQAFSGSTPLTWSRLRLVRNSWGVPGAEDDGWICLDLSAGDGTTTNPPQLTNSFLDATVQPGHLYYYAVFVAATVAAYSATTVYQPGDLASSGGQTWECLGANTLGVTPGAGVAQWELTSITTPWYRCGSGVVGLAVANAQYTQTIYDLIPRPYKVAVVETTATSVPLNDDLYNFVSIFGFHFDVMKSENDALLRLNDILGCSDRQLALIAQQVGILDRLPGLPELRRAYVRDAMAIQRGSGSAATVAELVTDVSGWHADVSVGYNELGNIDTAAFSSTRALPWNAGVQYFSAYVGVGDLVTYNGVLYEATNGTVQYSLYNMQSSVAITGSGTMLYVRDPALGHTDVGYAWWQNPSVGDTQTITFNVTQPPSGGGFGPLVAWTATLLMQFYTDPSSGSVTMSVGGTPVPDFTIDLYSPTRQLSPLIEVPVLLGAGTGQTIALTVTGRDGVSTGYDVFLAHFLVVPGDGVNLGITPGTSTKFWTPITVGSLTDGDTLRNMLTDGQANWNLQDPSGVINARPDNPRGSATSMLWGTVPFGATLGGSTSPGPGNSSAYTLPSGATGSASVQLYTGGGIQATEWDSGSGPAIAQSYQAGQPASLGEYYGEPNAVFTALTYTRDDYPLSSPTKWQQTSLANTVPEPSVVQRQCVPLTRPQVYYPFASYAFLDVVAWNGHIYQAAQPTQYNAPTGYDTDNAWWRWLGPDTTSYTFTVYHYRTATAANQYVRMEIDWFDQSGAYITNAVVADSRQLLLDRFEIDGISYPANTGSAPTGWSTPAAWQQGTGIPWVCDWGSWNALDGLAMPTGWTVATGTSTATNVSIMRAGRAVFFQRNWVYSGANADSIYVTFASQPVDTSGASGGPYTMEHGIVFRYGGGQYFLASRDRLTWAKLTYDANNQPTGTLSGANFSTLATWTPLANGSRMRVRVNTATIIVEAMTSAAPGTWTQLANITGNTTNNTNNGIGFLERIRA
ncbi:hypothetical protein ACIGXM_14240 [Kitasatospora sp. NPDC052896]|uniref:hypothetical protein n=1 Tax=Kitasatospora sp. NPDC052896 TaxID=3364061 RepID=UPI0037CA16D3